MTDYKQIKGNTYEEFVLNSLLNEYDNVYYFKDTPEYIIAKTKLYLNYQIYQKYKNCDIGADLVATKDDQVYFIQCKNFSQTISINDFCSFYFLILEFELNGIVYYNGLLSERLTDLARGKIIYNNLPYNNTIIDINFIGQEKIKIEPRDYQLEIYNEFKNIDRGIIALPCGMGKTFCSWLIGKDYNNIIIISPTRNLSDSNLVQLYNYSNNNYNPILISMDGSRNYKDIKSLLKNKNIISSTYDSVDVLNKIIKKLENYIIFIDEFHNLSANNLENSNNEINKLLTLNKKIIFLSATPIKNKKYDKIFGDYIYNYDWKKAIENKYICDFKIILPEDTSNIVIK
jgi:predicted helicase